MENSEPDENIIVTRTENDVILTNEFAGIYDFFIQLENSESKTWIYSALFDQVFIDMNRVLMMKFYLSKVEPGMYIRAMPIYTSSQLVQVPVKRCALHLVEDDPKSKSHEVSGVCLCSKYNNAGHFVRVSESLCPKYVFNVHTQRHSVMVPVPPKQPGSETISIPFQFSCKSSCIKGQDNRSMAVVFTLENSNQILGRRSINIKVCSCPKRDKARLESSKLKENEILGNLGIIDKKRKNQGDNKKNKNLDTSNKKKKTETSYNLDDELSDSDILIITDSKENPNLDELDELNEDNDNKKEDEDVEDEEDDDIWENLLFNEQTDDLQINEETSSERTISKKGLHKDFAGKNNFQMRVITDNTKSPSIYYSESCNLIFTRIEYILIVEFHMDLEDIKDTVIRATPIYQLAPHIPVETCILHKMKFDTKLEAHQKSDECRCPNFNYVNHFIKIGSDGFGNAVYEYCKKSGRHTLVVSVPQKHSREGKGFMVPYRFSCKSSCFKGREKRNISVLFTLEKKGVTIGRRSINVKICTCPKRDIITLELNQRKLRKEAQQKNKKELSEKKFVFNFNFTNKSNRDISLQTLHQGCEAVQEVKNEITRTLLELKQELSSICTVKF